MRVTSRLFVILLIAAAMILGGCSDDSNPVNSGPDTSEYDADMAIAWMDLSTDLVKEEKWTPPVASRLYGYTGVALYESVVKGMPNNRSLVGQLNELDELPEFSDANYHWPTVANAAVATFLRSMFASSSTATLDAITAMEDVNNQEFLNDTDASTYERSVNQGKLLGLAVFGWALNDGLPSFNNCTYTPPAGGGNWIPTPPAFAAPLQPCFGELRPFVMTSGSECMPEAPPAFNETAGSPFYLEMMEVYETASNLTEEQRTIADYWADNPGQTGTPPGHSIAIAGQVLADENADLGFAAETYAKVGMAVADAFICCWKTKYQYNLLRPISCIRTLVAADWNSPIPTPAFPEYTSGHSVQSGAAAQVLTDIFGENHVFTDHTHDGRGFASRSFGSFFEFADEAAISRLYGGIHFRSAIEKGLDQGKCIGSKVSDLDFEK